MPTRDEAWSQGTPCWVDCQVDDTAKARAYYSALLGWDVQDSPPEAGGYLMASLSGKPAAGIGEKSADMEMPSVWTTYFAADSADEVAEKITGAGGQVVIPAFDVMDVGRMLIATDPTGATFGVWEAKSHKGAGVFNENGAYCWNELHTGDYGAAKDFYSAVFGYTYTEVGDGVDFSYTTFTLPGGSDSVGGIFDDTMLPAEVPANWLTWFQSDDIDASLAKATELGSTVVMGPDDSPFGRMLVLAGQQGEVFGLIDPSTTVGEPPTES